MKTEPGMQGEELAERLLALRTATGLNGKDFADGLGWQPSKVSRLENNRQRPTKEDLTKWANACGRPDEADQLIRLLEELHATHRAWRRRARAGHALVQADYNKLVARSTRISEFTLTFVPGPLQTPAYARRVFAEMKELHALADDDVDQAVATRLERQRYLYDDTKQWEFLLAEPVVLWGLCPPDVMRAQLDRILTAMNLSHVRIGILPLRRPLARTPQNSFVLYDDTAFVETFTAETICGAEESLLYQRILDSLWAEAIEGDDAAALVRRTMGELDR